MLGIGLGFEVGMKDMQAKFTKQFRTMKSARNGPSIRSVSTPKYKLVQLLGSGAFSEVYSGKKGLLNPYKYAIKICTLEEEGTEASENEDPSLRSPLSTESRSPRAVSLEDCLYEIRIMREVQTKTDKFVVHLFDCFQLQNTVWIVMEILESSLRELLALQKDEDDAEIPVQHAAIYIHEVLLALKHLKEHRVIHRDIKPENIVISNTGRIKIIDFGISTIVPPRQDHCIVTSRIGTKQYMASELLIKGAAYDFSVDLWALGITLVNICNRGKNPYTYKGGFNNDHWEMYQISFERYLNVAFGYYVITQELREATGFQHLMRHHHGIRRIVQKCVVPLPKEGTVEFPITREVKEKRVTWEEFYEWSRGYVGKLSELTKRQVIMKHMRLVKELRVRRKKRIEEFGERTQDSSYNSSTLVHGNSLEGITL